jgi:hypothetical protein
MCGGCSLLMSVLNVHKIVGNIGELARLDSLKFNNSKNQQLPQLSICQQHCTSMLGINPPHRLQQLHQHRR